MAEAERNWEEQVRRRAHELWEKAGQPEGRGEEFWHQAAAELTARNDADSKDGDEKKAPKKVTQPNGAGSVKPP